MVYWLKTQTDIDSSDYAYDANSFPLDSNAIELDLDVPMRKYNVKKIIGNGASISGGDTFGDRVISFSRIFKTDGVSTSGALNQGRLDFISKFIVSRDDIYLIRDYNGSLQYIKVSPVMKGESYKKFVISGDIKIDLLCSKPFFSEVTETATALFDKTSRFLTKSITNAGVQTPFIFEGTFDAIDANFKMEVYRNTGIDITTAFAANDVLKIDTGTFRIWINGIERFNLTIVGTPFELLSGVNSLRIESISNLSDCKISYTGRHI